MKMFKIIEKIAYAESIYPSPLFDTSNRLYSFVNPYGYHLVRKNLSLFERLDGLYVDGILMCVFIRAFYQIKVVRRSFDLTTVARDLFNRIKETGETIYLVGAKQEEIEQTVSLIRKEYPTAHIVGFRNGYFTSNEEKLACYNSIIELNPTFVVVGMGAVLQEQFIVDLQDQGYRGICFTCGGYLRQAASGLNYFPEWSNRFHLRAFYRLYKEKGMFKRLYNVLIEFPVLFIYDRLLH